MKNRIGSEMNDLDLCFEVIWGHVNQRVTFAIEYVSKPLEIEAVGSKGLPNTNRKWPMARRMVRWTMT